MPRNKKRTSGGEANKNGRILERQIVPLLEENGYKEQPPVAGEKTFQRHVYVGETVYGSKRHVDILITERDGSKKCIECKYQKSKGSVDEKFVFLHENIKKTGIPTYVVHGGGGQKPCSIRWLQEQITPRSKMRSVTDLDGLTTLINNNWE
jgi:hypothetical protein